MTVTPDAGGRSEETTVRVLICDDHAVFRQGLLMVLGDDEGVDVVGEAADGGEAVTKAIEMAPDVVLMDVRMPVVSGIEATRRIADAVPATRIIMLTASDEDDDLYDAVKAGAAGYLLKDLSIDEVGSAVRAVAAGHSLISPAVAGKLLSEFTTLSKAERGPEPPSVPTPELTERELEVLRLVAEGLSNRQVATKLYIAENTVKNHVRNILEKLHLHSRMEAVVYAVRQKLVDLDE